MIENEGGRAMPMIFCPECMSRISDKAITCPHCGFTVSSGGEIVPISQAKSSQPAPLIEIPQVAIFDSGIDLLPAADNERIVKFVFDRERLAELAPALYNVIENMIGRGDEKYVADFSKKVQKLIKEGKLKLSVDRKTKDLIPQAYDPNTGRIIEKARVHLEEIPKDVAPSVVMLQTQVMMAQLMDEIQEVAAGVEALRLESQADRLARAESVWQQLEQAARIKDARLRESQILAIAASATEAKCILQANFKTELFLASEKKGGYKTWSKSAENAMGDLSSIALMARTEYVAYTMLEEHGAAAAALAQFRHFVLENKLNDRDVLLKLNSQGKDDRSHIVNGFLTLAEDVSQLDLEEGHGPIGLLEPNDEEGETDDE